MEVVPNDPVSDVSGTAANADFIQKIYCQRHIFDLECQSCFPEVLKGLDQREEGRGWCEVEGFHFLPSRDENEDEIFKNSRGREKSEGSVNVGSAL